MPDLVLRYEARVNALRASSFHYIDEGVLQEYTLGKLERNYIRDRNVVSQISSLELRSHLGQNLDKFVLITQKSVKFLSSVDHAKCNLLFSTRTKTCPRRQIFKGAVVLPRSTTFCEQQTKIVSLVINLPVNSVKIISLFFPLHILTCQARA